MLVGLICAIVVSSYMNLTYVTTVSSIAIIQNYVSVNYCIRVNSSEVPTLEGLRLQAVANSVLDEPCEISIC